LIIPFPAVDEVVAAWRTRCDPSAPLGVPAHVTVHLPWLPEALVDSGVLNDLDAMVASVPRFEVAFRRVGWFEREVLWLDPEPNDRFMSLITASLRQWPDYPPFGGQFDTVVPHLTVGMARGGELDQVAAEVAAVLPIRDVASQVWWITRHGLDRWRIRHRVQMG